MIARPRRSRRPRRARSHSPLQRRPERRRSPGVRCPACVRRLNFAIAISAPVLPAETATSASPFFTASIASHIEDFQRPWRSAWLGLSSILTTTSVWTIREAAFSRGLRSTSGRDRGLVAEEDEFAVGMAREREFGPRNDHRRPEVAPHGIERNSDLLGHEPSVAVLDVGSDAPRGRDNSGSAAGAQRASQAACYSLTVPFFCNAASAANGLPAASDCGFGRSNATPGLRG